MNIDLTNRLYKLDNRVYLGYNRVTVHNQRGRFFVKYNGRQVNVKEIPVKPDDEDCVFNYVFKGQFKTHPCSAMEYWIYRHRLGNKITASKYKEKFNIHERKTKAIYQQTKKLWEGLKELISASVQNVKQPQLDYLLNLLLNLISI